MKTLSFTTSTTLAYHEMGKPLHKSELEWAKERIFNLSFLLDQIGSERDYYQNEVQSKVNEITELEEIIHKLRTAAIKPKRRKKSKTAS